MKSVSVHIVTFNSEKFITDCLHAVFNQTYPVDSVIIMDNASQDCTLEVLSEFDGRITLIRNETNDGFAKAHNDAIRMSQTDYIVVLNPDVTLHPDYVRYLVEAMDENPLLGSATGKLLLKQSPDEVDSTGLTMTKARRAFDRGAGTSKDLWNAQEQVFGVSGAAALYSRNMIEDISIQGCFFDEDFFAYKEDVDVAWRSQLLGWSSVYYPKAVAYHDRGWKKGSSSREQIPLRIRRYSYINRYKMMIKNERPLAMLKDIFHIGFYEAGSTAYFLMKEPKVLGAWMSFVRQLPELLQKRRIIQQKRKVEWRRIYSFFK